MCSISNCILNCFVACSGLQHLHLEIRSDQDDKFILSKITAAICFSRIPGLVIELDSYTKMPQGLTAMQCGNSSQRNPLLAVTNFCWLQSEVGFNLLLLFEQNFLLP